MTTQLRVVVNPYAATDHLGRPSGAVLFEPKDHVPYRDNPRHPDPRRRYQPRQYIGATMVSKRLAQDVVTKVGSAKHVRAGAHDTSWSHEKGVITIAPPTPKSLFYYARLIAEQALFAADLATWVACGFKAALFQEPAEKLAQAKEGAIAQFIAHHGEDDPRLADLAKHWDDHVAQRHPVGLKLTGKSAPAPKPAPAAPTTTSAAPAAPTPATPSASPAAASTPKGS